MVHTMLWNCIAVALAAETCRGKKRKAPTAPLLSCRDMTVLCRDHAWFERASALALHPIDLGEDDEDGGGR